MKKNLKMILLPLCAMAQKWSHLTTEGSWYIHAASCPDYDSWSTNGTWVSSKLNAQDDSFYPAGMAHSADAGKACIEMATDYFGQNAYLRGIQFEEPASCGVFFDDGHVGTDIKKPTNGDWWLNSAPSGSGAWDPSTGSGNWSHSGTCYGFNRKTAATANTCSNADGTRVTCGTGFSSKPGSTSCTACDNDGYECCVCGFDDWGAGIPFVDGGKIKITDNLRNGNLNLTFTLATEPCVDRDNQLSLSFRGTGDPVCQAADPSDNAACAARLSGGKSQCMQDSKCRYRIACTKGDLELKELFRVEQTHKQKEPHTEYNIAIKTGLLSTQGVNAGIYTAAQASSLTAKIEVCLRASVALDNVEVLFREVVASVSMDMTGGVSLDIKSDSYDAGGLEDVDADVDFTTDAFACQSTQSNGVITYQKVSPAPLTPNSVLTLCITGKSTTVHCTDVQELIFKQGTETTENRISNFAVNNLLTEKRTGVNILADSVALKGCAVAARLGGVYFQGLNPENVVITGTALLDFVPTGGRRLLSETAQSTTVAVEVGEALNNQASDFDAQFEIAKSPNAGINQNEIDEKDTVSAAGSSAHCMVAAGIFICGFY